MSLPPGTRFGPYQIQSPIGVGGMGEVYRARDTRGIGHRDLKPENILVTHDDRIKILDFGLAKVKGEPLAMVISWPALVKR